MLIRVFESHFWLLGTRLILDAWLFQKSLDIESFIIEKLCCLVGSTYSKVSTPIEKSRDIKAILRSERSEIMGYV